MKHPTDDSTFDMFGFYGSKGHEMARLSSDRADRELGDWSTKAHNFLMQFARLNQNPFLVEEARAYAELCGLKAPPDGRVGDILFKPQGVNSFLSLVAMA